MSTARVVAVEDLRRSPRAALFEGGDAIPASIFLTTNQKGEGPSLHVHPYDEVFVVEAGSALFTVGDDQVPVDAGHIVVVPPETPHGFKSAGDDSLRVISFHPSPTVQQTDL